MEPRNISNSKTTLLLLSVVLSLNAACATEAGEVALKAATLTQAYVWYDGERE